MYESTESQGSGFWGTISKWLLIIGGAIAAFFSFSWLFGKEDGKPSHWDTMQEKFSKSVGHSIVGEAMDAVKDTARKGKNTIKGAVMGEVRGIKNYIEDKIPFSWYAFGDPSAGDYKKMIDDGLKVDLKNYPHIAMVTSELARERKFLKFPTDSGVPAHIDEKQVAYGGFDVFYPGNDQVFRRAVMAEIKEAADQMSATNKWTKNPLTWVMPWKWEEDPAYMQGESRKRLMQSALQELDEYQKKFSYKEDVAKAVFALSHNGMLERFGIPKDSIPDLMDPNILAKVKDAIDAQREMCKVKDPQNLADIIQRAHDGLDTYVYYIHQQRIRMHKAIEDAKSAASGIPAPVDAKHAPLPTGLPSKSDSTAAVSSAGSSGKPATAAAAGK